MNEYSTANHVEHPPTVYLREDVIVPRLDAWLAKLFAPHRLAETVEALAGASEQDDESEIVAAGLRKQLADCERKLTQYRALRVSTRPRSGRRPCGQRLCAPR